MDDKKCSYCKTVKPIRDGYKLCGDCLVKSNIRNRERFATRKAAGLCIHCSLPQSAPGSLCCELCVLKKAASKTLKDRSRAAEIGELLKQQDYRCPYSGIKLVLGVNASLDHKTPKCRGGTDEIQNLHWIESGLNRLKREKTHEEFVPYLKELALGALSVLV